MRGKRKNQSGDEKENDFPSLPFDLYTQLVRPGVIPANFHHFSGEIYPSITCNLFLNLPSTISAQDQKVFGSKPRRTILENPGVFDGDFAVSASCTTLHHP